MRPFQPELSSAAARHPTTRTSADVSSSSADRSLASESDIRLLSQRFAPFITQYVHKRQHGDLKFLHKYSPSCPHTLQHPQNAPLHTRHWSTTAPTRPNHTSQANQSTCHVQMPAYIERIALSREPRTAVTSICPLPRLTFGELHKQKST